MGKSSSIYSINIFKTFNYDKNRKAFTMSRTLALSPPSARPTNHSLPAVTGLLQLRALAPMVPTSLGSTATSATWRREVHSPPFLPAEIHPFLSGWSLHYFSPPLYIDYPLLFSSRASHGRWERGGQGWMWPCPPPFSHPLYCQGWASSSQRRRTHRPPPNGGWPKR